MAVYDGVIVKHVSEDFYIGFRVLAPDLASGETISTCTATATTGLTLDASCTISGDEVSVGVSSGVAASDYVVRFVVTTSAGNTFVYDYLVKVIA